MTDLEPALIASQFLAERLESGVDPDVYAHWLGGATPDMLAGTTIPGNVHLDVGPLPPDEPLPMLDLSWTPPDPAAILADIEDALGLRPEPPALTAQEFVDALRDALDWPTGPPTEQFPTITEEDE